MQTLKKYNIIYADPPWQYECKRTGAAENHYSTMSIDELCALPVKEIADKDSLLFFVGDFPTTKRSITTYRSMGL